MLFDKIAPIYALFFGSQVKYYRNVLYRIKEYVDITQYKKILDLGCGTGALCYVLHELGLEVIGVDASSGMLKQARKKLGNTSVQLLEIDPAEALPFKDNSFDLAISSYVVHGLKTNERERLYKELCKVSKGKIIFHDYNGKRFLITDIVEFLENGDYFNFIKVAGKEMSKHFRSVKIVNIDKRSAWYILEHCNT